MNPTFCSLVSVTHIVYLPRDSIRPVSMSWLNAEDKIVMLTLEVDADDDDDSGDSWASLELQIPTLMHWFKQVCMVCVYSCMLYGMCV